MKRNQRREVLKTAAMLDITAKFFSSTKRKRAKSQSVSGL